MRTGSRRNAGNCPNLLHSFFCFVWFFETAGILDHFHLLGTWCSLNRLTNPCCVECTLETYVPNNDICKHFSIEIMMQTMQYLIVNTQYMTPGHESKKDGVRQYLEYLVEKIFGPNLRPIYG